MSQQHYPVVIVGGGPVGFALAIELGQRGVECAVVEKYPQPLPIPKGQNLTGRTMEHFHFWGAEKELREASLIPREFGGGVTAYGSLLSGYSYDWQERHWVKPFYFKQNERLPQYQTESVLRARAAQIAEISTYLGWTATEVQQGDKRASITIEETQGTQQQRISGDYVVGCDGSRSLVREQVGITQSVAEHDKRMVLLVFKSPQLHNLLEADYPKKSFYNVLQPGLKGYWLFFGRVDFGNSWFFHAPVPADTSKDNFDFAAYLHSAVGAEFELEFEYIGFWDLRIAIAEDYKKGCAFIAGDAAHSHPPYGGYGINTGFEDARNLGWKLAATIQGWGGDNLLPSYSSERQPVFASTARDFIENYIEQDAEFVAQYSPDENKAAFESAWQARSENAPSEIKAYEPCYAGSELVWGDANAVTTAKGTHSFKARAGHHLAPLVLSNGENLYEVLQPCFTLIALDADDKEVAEFESAAQQLGVPFSVIRDKQQGQLTDFAAKLILLRPDQFVAWLGDRLEVSAKEVLNKAVGG